MKPDSTRRDALRLLAALPVAGLLAGCSDILTLPGQGPQPELFRLTPKSTFDEDLPNVSWQLLIDEPVTHGALNTTRVPIMLDPTRMQYYAQANWTDRIPVMVQTLMLESFQNSDRIVAVGRNAVALRGDYQLKSDIREFQIEYFDTEVPVAHVGINANLVRLPERQIIGFRRFDAEFQATADNADALVAAFDEALGKVLRDLVGWALVTGETDSRREREGRSS
jgi:cholesterol transport system auxiliary component